MQFELSHRIGETFNDVRLSFDRMNTATIVSLAKSFNRIGGKAIGYTLWRFPSFITSEVIQEIIHNTCFECGGLMGDSTAIQNESLRIKTSQGEIHYPDGNNTKVIKVRKCQSCGHSHT